MRIRDPESYKPWIRDVKSGIQDPGSATLATSPNSFVRTSVKGGVYQSKLIPWDPYRTYLRWSSVILDPFDLLDPRLTY
jgi:hypothetical protein